LVRCRLSDLLTIPPPQSKLQTEHDEPAFRALQSDLDGVAAETVTRPRRAVLHAATHPRRRVGTQKPM
jgi:hypothetical protein